MRDKNVFLRPNTVIEPLWDQWYAWSHLISPATAAMSLVGRHMNIMNSFTMAPKVHEAAVKNPKLLGGPFMDISPDRVDEIKALVAETKEKRTVQLELADALKELNRLIIQEGKGYTLDTLYAKIPDILRGYVELVYDLNNQPSYRLFEALMYHGDLYAEDAQSIALWVTKNDERPFALSTPKLKGDPDVLHFDIRFKDKVIDRLSKMKREAYPYNEIKRELGVSEEEEALFQTLFTEEAPKPYEPYLGDKVRMRYLGHACILVEIKGISILLDPLVSYYGYQTEVGRYSDLDLPDVIDYVLITHNHQDHILFETLLPMRHRIKNIVVPATTSGSLQDPNLKFMLEAIGFENVHEIHDLESIRFEDCTITGVPFMGEHSDLNIQSKVCHHIKVGEFSMLFAADSCNVEPRLYQHVHRLLGDVDVLFLGMECEGAPLSWMYGPLLSEKLDRDKDQSRRLAGSNCERGMNIVNAIKSSEVYVYAMGMEPWLEYISSIKYTDESKPIIESNALIAACKAQGLIAERLFGEKEILYSKEKSLV